MDLGFLRCASRRPMGEGPVKLGELELAATLVRQFAEFAQRLDPSATDALTAPCPCESCRFAARCAAEQRACEAFALFVQGLAEPRWRLAPRAPTRARYLVIYEKPLPQRRKGPRRAHAIDRECDSHALVSVLQLLPSAEIMVSGAGYSYFRRRRALQRVA
jgi:hypothetical protein